MIRKDPAADQPRQYVGRASLINIDSEIHEYEDTAALLACPDLVVTVDTTVGYLATATDKLDSILLATPPDRRWPLSRESASWHPTAQTSGNCG